MKHAFAFVGLGLLATGIAAMLAHAGAEHILDVGPSPREFIAVAAAIGFALAAVIDVRR